MHVGSGRATVNSSDKNSRINLDGWNLNTNIFFQDLENNPKRWYRLKIIFDGSPDAWAPVYRSNPDNHLMASEPDQICFAHT